MVELVEDHERAAGYFPMFYDWSGMSPEEPLERKREGLGFRDPRIQRRMESMLRRFVATCMIGGSVRPPSRRPTRLRWIPMSRSAMSNLITYHAQKVGLKGISAHPLRKFFQTQLEAAGVHPNWVAQIVGHKPPSVESSYSRPTDEQLREAYVKAYHSLRVYPTQVTWEELMEDTTLPNGGRRYRAKIVDAEELVGYVEDGWEVVCELRDGRMVVRKALA